jgi:hypothetical protein
MKKLFLLFALLISTESCIASKVSVVVNPNPSKTVILTDTTINDGWDEDTTWSPKPLLPQEKPEKTKAEKKAEKKAARKQEREDNPSNFPRGVAWSSVALALIGLIKIAIQTCK